MKLDSTRLDQIRKKYNLSLILLFGSHVNGKTHSRSDVDIAIVRTEKDNNDFLTILKELALALETDKIDLSDITHADPLYLFAVVTKSKLLSGAKEDYDRLQRIAFKKYSDYQPYLEKEKEYVIEKFRNYVTD